MTNLWRVAKMVLASSISPTFVRAIQRFSSADAFMPPPLFAAISLLVIAVFSLSLSVPAENIDPRSGNSTATLRFSPQPTVSEISSVRVFDEPLLAFGSEPGAAENKALAYALVAYSCRTDLDDFSSLSGFLARFPDSAWSASLLLHLGTEYYNYGYYSKAMDSWEQAWQQFKDVANPHGKTQADRALGELARMYSKLGKMRELSALLDSTTNRPLSGPGTVLVHAAHQGLWMMQNRPEVSFRCGPLALSSILSQKDPKKALDPLLFYSKSTTNGYSMAQLGRLSWDLGINYQMAFRSPGAPWVVPAVIHWKVGHYAALLRRDGSRFLVKDNTFQSSLLITTTALEQESSGYFLVPQGPLPAGWRAVSDAEAQNIWGKGTITGQDLTQIGTGPNITHSGGDSCAGAVNPANPATAYGTATPGDASAANDPNAVSSCSGCAGMTTYTMDTMLASLSLNDTPVGYKPPVGPWVEFTATYDQNDNNPVATFAYSNLGQKWTCNWIAYINDNPNSPGADVTYYQPGGGTLSFTGFNSNSHTYATDPVTQAVLVLTSSSSYEMQFRSGVREEFALSNGSTTSTRFIFLTEIIDAAGNAVRLNYDSNLRITNIVDTIGQTTVLSYTNVNYPNTITAVTDPFGRTAGFSYNSSGLLTQTTDVLGMQSQYVYDSNEFVTNLITPYGTTVFTSGTINGGPWLQVTDPLGESELAEAPLSGLAIAASDPTSTLPTNMPVAPYNQYLNVRDTFFWDKNAYEAGAGIPSDATIYHFCHVGITSIEGGVLESVKKPLENRLWYNYPNQTQGNVFEAPSINRPSAVGRVLDDGSTQLRSYEYNSLGHVTNSTDPLGRNFTYVYATNGVDLLQVVMTSHGKNEVQLTMTYNAQHRPLTITDAAGQTTTNSYNDRGQILRITDPLGEMTSFAYDANGYLLAITGPLQTTNDVTSFTYDSFGRVQTVMDTEGYTLAYAYDAMDRVTNISYPDGTVGQFVYSNLDLVASADRLGRWTTNNYNADHQLLQTQDPLGRITQYQYCDCGALEALFDPAGNATSWDHDLQGRTTAKHYADGSTITFAYENTTSRLHSRLDEKTQQKVYQYYADDKIASISYSNAVVATPTVSYTYDTNYDRFVTMQDGIGTTVYTYNPITTNPSFGAGRLASVSGPLPYSTVVYQYDQLERVISRAINGVAQATTFDALGRATIVTNALGTFQYSYENATPRLTSEVYPNGQTNLYAYYNNTGDQRLSQIQHFYPNGSFLSGFGYAYNAVGQITAWTNEWDTLPAREWFPSYDAADQLTNVVVAGGSGALTSYNYAYDLAGNRTLAGTNGINNRYYYNALNQVVGTSFTLANVSYEWDAENRLTAINKGLNRSEFCYDGMGRRVKSVEKTNSIVVASNYYFWCGSGICEVRDSSGTNVLKRLFPQGESLVGITVSTDYFYLRDHLGSIREAVDGIGNIITRYDYDPYGQKTVLTEGFQPTFGFTGDFIHQESGLLLTWFRALDTANGRWLGRDPIGESASVNMYAYVRADPLVAIDPLGLCSGAFDSNLGNVWWNAEWTTFWAESNQEIQEGDWRWNALDIIAFGFTSLVNTWSDPSASGWRKAGTLANTAIGIAGGYALEKLNYALFVEQLRNADNLEMIGRSAVNYINQRTLLNALGRVGDIGTINDLQQEAQNQWRRK